MGGAWRSRRIRFPAGPGLRPTPDRVRETLFNWLGPWIEGRRVLDLFAGSGALGLEALSRGAASAVFVERSREALAALRDNLLVLGAEERATLVPGEAIRFLEREAAGFDLVFVDPPYASGLAHAALRTLDARRILLPGGRVYLEHGAEAGGERDETFLQRWETYRTTRAGDVQASLLLPRVSPAAMPGPEAG